MRQQQPFSDASGRHPAAKFHGSFLTQRTPLVVLSGAIVLNERWTRLVCSGEHLLAIAGFLPINPTLRHKQYQEVASDGRSAHVNVIPTLKVAEAVWCVKLHPSRLWSPVGTATTAVDGPQITSGNFVADHALSPASNPLLLPMNDPLDDLCDSSVCSDKVISGQCKCF